MATFLDLIKDHDYIDTSEVDMVKMCWGFAR
jgi:hypothetical protein